MKSSWRFAGLIALLLAGGALVNAWAYLGEASVPRKELKDFPRQMKIWQQVGIEQRFSSETMKVLGASDYILRDYRSTDGEIANFYVGYYATQRDGVSYHSPLNCLPGAGWVMNSPGSITITPTDGRAPFQANMYRIENGDSKDIMIYWYQGRGRRIASEYWGKIYTVLDSVRMRRSDAAMVRVTVPVGSSEPEAIKAAAGFAADASSILPEFVPD